MLELKSAKEVRGTVVLPPDPDLLPMIAATALVSRCPAVIKEFEETPYIAELAQRFTSHMEIAREGDQLTLTPRDDCAEPVELTTQDLYCGDFVLFTLLGAGYRVAFHGLTGDRVQEWTAFAESTHSVLCVEEEGPYTVVGLTLQPETSLPQVSVPQEQLQAVLGLALGMGATVSVTVEYHVSTPIRHLLTLFGYEFDVRGTERGSSNLARRIQRIARKAHQTLPVLLTIEADFSTRPRDTVEVQLPGDQSLAATYIAAKALVQRGNLVIDNVCLESWANPIIQVLRRMGCSPALQASRQSSFGQVGMVQLQRFERAGRRVDCVPLSQYRRQLPAMVAVALFSQGESVFRNLAPLRHDTPDTLQMLLSFLRTIGAHHGEMPDGFVLRGASQYDGFDIADPLPGYMAAAWAVAALKCMGTSSIEDTALTQRWPEFAQTLTSLCQTRT